MVTERKVGDIIVCNLCGGRAKIEKIDGRELTFELLDSGAMPVSCDDCGSQFCANCGAKENGCPRCSSSNVHLYNGSARLKSIATPREADELIAARRGAEDGASIDNQSELRMEQVADLVKMLNAPVYKIWVDKHAALASLAILGDGIQDSFPVVLKFLRRPAYALGAIRVLSAAGSTAKNEVPKLVEILGSDPGYPGSAAAAALAISSLAARDVEVRAAEAALSGVLERDRRKRDTGVRCMACIGLMALGKLSADETNELLRDHAFEIQNGYEFFPAENDLQQLIDNRGANSAIKLP